MSGRYFSINQLSIATGKDRRTVKDRLSKILPEKKAGKAIIYDGHKAFPALFKVEDVKEQLLSESLRLEKGRADKIELELAKISGSQVPIEDVAAVVEKEYTRVRAQLISIPNKISRDLAVIDDPREITIILEDSINEALSELSAAEKFKNHQLPDEDEDEDNSTESGESSDSR